MNIDTKQLLAQCIAAKIKSGEDYFSLRMDIVIGRDSTGEVKFGCYTPNTNHTREYDEPNAAIEDTLMACADPEKLLARAAILENLAKQLRYRVGGAR